MKKLTLLLSITVACLTTARAAISVGASGSALYDFTTQPTVASGWSVRTVGTAATTYTTAGLLDANAQTNVASSITTALASSGTINPPSQNNTPRWNSVSNYLQSRPTGNDYGILLATLQNDSPGPISTITIAYKYGVEVTNTMTTPTPSPITEDVPGFRVFWSLSGTANNWTLIPGLSGVTTNGLLTAVINVGSWAAATPMYIMWVDDNGPGGNAQPGNQEGVYTIDDFQITVGGVVTENVFISSPTNNANFAQGLPINITASATMAGTISGVEFYHDSVTPGNLITNDTTLPYTASYTGATLGDHTLIVVATDNTHSITSTSITVHVNANLPPTVTVTNPVGQSFFVGSDITNTAVAADSDGTVTGVLFYVDGVLAYTDATSTYKFEYDDALPGAHTILAVAVDSLGARGSNTVSFTITNPPNVTFLLTNGSTWKYLDDTNDPSLAGVWQSLGFNDSGWSNGVAEIGFGDSAQDRPEKTLMRRVVGPYTNITFYFRKVINVANPSAFSGLVLDVKQDDGSIVYFNGVEVYRSTNMPAGPVNHGTFALSTQQDDGAAYYTTNLPTSVLVAGQNIIAVEMHQDAYASSDISFDVMLWGIGGSSGPSLKINRISATQADISWPIGGAALLYHTSNLNSPTTWTLETALDTPSGGFHHVTVNTAGGIKFWTLRQ